MTEAQLDFLSKHLDAIKDSFDELLEHVETDAETTFKLCSMDNRICAMNDLLEFFKLEHCSKKKGVKR
jgi:hypothetical protein